MPNVVAAVMAGAVVALIPAAPPEPASSLRLTLAHPDRGTSRSVTLRCEPTGGGHPEAARACSELSGSGGKIAHAPDGRMCTAVHSPVTARAKGRWRGKPVHFQAEYGNDCAMRSRTGTVFAF
ncbi:SSI family serine proteinase inhibitor [Actinomadura sp. 7K507]|uniref:SSI family serine proteinase inhibitor n=1 Tax=Actinomadura sp. 7K507 TaxID=2530365 RepID=UPI00104906B3|nr:SSI family serine proteinase inhibitor [Actinomadura sp. 7K507]TDC83169.1 serine protease [Actinomadura sp. 7K507]